MCIRCISSKCDELSIYVHIYAMLIEMSKWDTKIQQCYLFLMQKCSSKAKCCNDLNSKLKHCC